MPPDHSATIMDQKIFKMGLPVETVSAYLLCCSLVDTGSALSHRRLQERWNGSAPALRQALQQLVDCGILCPILSAADRHEVFSLQAVEKWRLNCPGSQFR